MSDFWVTKAAGRVRNAATSSGEVLGEVAKGDFVKVVTQEGDWIQVANIWEDKGDAWLMYQNKKGKQLAEAASDAGAAEAEFSKVEAWLKACRAALADEKDPPPDPRAPPVSAGVGGDGGEGFNSDSVGVGAPKKAVSEEEAELLAMLKGFGSNASAFAEGGGAGEGGEAPPEKEKSAAGASKQPAVTGPKPTAEKSKPKSKPAAAASSGPPPEDMSEAELLAMLKGVGSGAPAGGDGEGGEPKAAGSIEERVDDSDFKVRKQAYADLAELFSKEAEASECFAMKAVGGEHIVECAATEKNAMAFVDGIAVCELYFKKAASTPAASALAPLVAEAMIKSGFKQAKAKVVSQCRRTVVQCVQCAPEPVLVALFAGIAADGPKIPVDSVKCLTAVVGAYGPFVLPLKKICGKMIELLEKPDKKIKEEALALLTELGKWMGRPSLSFVIAKLGKKEQDGLDVKLAEAGPPPTQTPPMQLLKRGEGDDYGRRAFEFDGEGNLMLDLVEPVDLVANLKGTEYAVKVKSEKWNERVEAFGFVVNCCGTPPKLLPGQDYSKVLEALKKGVEDKMVAVSIAAVGAIGVVADGLGVEFKANAKGCATTFIEKMKDAKLVAPGIAALSKMYGRSLSLSDVSTPIQNAVFPQKGKVIPPHTQVAVLQFTAYACGREGCALGKSEVEFVVALGMDSLTKISDPKVKAATVDMMTAMLATELRQAAEAGEVGKQGKCGKALRTLAEGKDSGLKMLYKKIVEAADPSAASAAAETEAAPKEKKGTDSGKGKEKKSSKAKKEKAKGDGDGGGGGGGADSKEKRLDMDEDTAMSLLEELNIPNFSQLMKDMGGDKWAEKMEACQKLGGAPFYAGKVHSHSPALVTVLKLKTAKLNDKNANVMKGVFGGIASCAAQSSSESGFDKGAAKECILAGGEKMGDKKQAQAVRGMLTKLSESISPAFVLKHLGSALTQVKAVGAHQEGVPWAAEAVKDFGVSAVGDKDVAAFCATEFEAVGKKDAKTKAAITALLCECYKQKGPAFVKKHMKAGWDAATLKALEAEFQKVGFDPSQEKNASKVSLAAPASGDAGGGDGDREDVAKLLGDAKEVLGKLADGDNKKWKDRKEAMEKIISSLDGLEVTATPLNKELAKAVAKCLNDLQQNNKPLAAQALGALFAALPAAEAEAVLKAAIKPLMVACADAKSTMREESVSAMDKACGGGGKSVEVVIGGLCGKEEGLVKPLSRSVLLEWCCTRFPGLEAGAVKLGGESLLLNRLLDCMNDKDSSVRALAEKVVSLVWAKKGCKKSDFDAALEKLSEATKRTTQERVDSILSETPQESSSNAATSTSSSKGAAAAAAAGDLPPNLGSGGSSELMDFMQCFQAMAANGEEGKKLRKKGFCIADPNGNGLCSLAELEGFVLKTLLAEYPKDIKKKDGRGDKLEYGKDLFTAFRPCYIRAFADAKDYKADTGKVLEGTNEASADDFVTKGEFRLFCAYIVMYAAMFDAFSKVDGGAAGRDANDDRRVDLNEWLTGYRGIEKYGFVALTGMGDEVAATGVFKSMDDNGGGVVLLEEFCTFLKATEMKAGTEMGGLLAADEAGGIGKQDRATKLAGSEASTTKGVVGVSAPKAGKAIPNNSASRQKKQKPEPATSAAAVVEATAPPPTKEKVTIAKKAGSAGGSSTADLPPNLGSGGSSELMDFMQCFQAMAANGEEGKKLRKKGFSIADPNGNGLCSLAELEGFVLKTLLAEYPKDIKKKDGRGDKLEYGKDLFTAFRPCYIRAFADAKDYKADTGKVLEGTNEASADDFVTKGEFRLFCAYIVMYAAMFDAFSKVDGGAAGRDANDDRRVDLGEWLAGYGGIEKYGFVALTGMGDEVAATGVFKSMDDNGGGVVLLEEFCTFLKATEMKAGTEMGGLLAADEAGGIGKQDRATKLAGSRPPTVAEEKKGKTNEGNSDGDGKKKSKKSSSSSSKIKKGTTDTTTEATASSGGGGGGCCFLPNKRKEKREASSSKSSSSSKAWPVPHGSSSSSSSSSASSGSENSLLGLCGEKETEALKIEWEKSLAKGAVSAFFPKKAGSMDCGNAAIELIAEAVSGGDIPLLGSHLDLVFKWFMLRLCEKESVPTLLRIIEVLQALLDKLCLSPSTYRVACFEAKLLVPFVLEKCGSGKDRVAGGFKKVLATLSHSMTTTSGGGDGEGTADCYVQLCAKALLKTKNAKTQVVILEDLVRLVGEKRRPHLFSAPANGGSSSSSKAVSVGPAIAKAVDSKDSTVRHAALNVCAALFEAEPTAAATPRERKEQVLKFLKSGGGGGKSKGGGKTSSSSSSAVSLSDKGTAAVEAKLEPFMATTATQDQDQDHEEAKDKEEAKDEEERAAEWRLSRSSVHNPLSAPPDSSSSSSSAVESKDDDTAAVAAAAGAEAAFTPPAAAPRSKRRAVASGLFPAASNGGASSGGTSSDDGAHDPLLAPPLLPSPPPPPPPPPAQADFEAEILSHLDTLLSAPLPLDKESELYLDGKDAIKVIHSVASGSEPPDFSFHQPVVVEYANEIVVKVTACLDRAFTCHAPILVPEEAEAFPNTGGGGGIDVQLLSVCLAALMALFRVPEICRAANTETLKAVLGTCVARLLDSRLASTNDGPYSKNSLQITKALNKVAIQSSHQAPSSHCFAALLHLLTVKSEPPPMAHAQFEAKSAVIYSKLFNRIVSNEIETSSSHPFATVDLPTVFRALAHAFTAHPTRDATAFSEVPHDAALGLLKRLVLHLGTEKVVAVVNKELAEKAGEFILAVIQREF